MAIGKILSDVLKEKNTTVTDLARNINVAPTTIYSIIERDNMKIDISILIKICKSLNIDINLFYKDYVDNKSNIKAKDDDFTIKYNQLNESGQSKLMERLDELLELPKYRKEWQTFVLCLYYRTAVLICQQDIERIFLNCRFLYNFDKNLIVIYC